MRLCLGQGGWVPQMEATLGKVGVVVEVLPSGNLRIQCGGSLRPYIYPPALIAEHLNAQTGPPLFVLDLHPHSLVRLDHGGHCAVCKRPFEGITEAEKENNAAPDADMAAEDAAPQDHAAMAAFLSGPAARGDKICGFGCEAAEFFMCELCCRPYQLEPLRQHQDLDASGQALAVAEASLRLGAQCKLQHGPGKWLNAVVVETLPNSKVRVHVPMEEVPDQELEVTSPKLKPTRTEALELCRPACYPEGLHRVCFPHGLRGTLFGEPVHCSSDDCMPGGCRGGKSQESSRVVAYFCPRTAFLLCETCIQAPDLGQVTAETCQQDIQKLKDPESCAVAAKRILGLCNRSQQARILFLDAGLCSAVATAVHAARGSFDLVQFSSLAGSPGVQESSSGGQALLQLLTRLAQWLYLAAPLKRGKLGRLLVNVPVESRSQLDEENSDAYSSAAHLYEFLTGRSRKPEPSEEEVEDDDWREAELVEDEHEEVQVKMLHGGIRLSVPKERVTTLTLPEVLPACVPLPKRANLPSPMVLTQDWLMKHALPRNDLFLAKRVLMDRADLTACDRQGNSVLAVAVEHQCSQEMVELLLERGCPRSSKGPLGPPLSIAARSGRLEVVRVLLDFGCDPCEIEASGKLSEAAKNLLGYLVPLPDPVLRRGKEGSLPLRCLRRQLAVETLLPLASSMLPSLQGGQRNLDAQLVQVLVLACEHAAPLPAEALESLVQVCRSLLMSFESSSMNLGLRLASCLCEAGKDGVEKLRRHGIFKMLPALAAAPELHQPPRPQHIRQAAAKILSRWSEEVARSEPTPCLASAERWQELQHLTPSELITLKVPQKLLRDAAFRSAMPKELAPMLLQVVEEEEKFSVHVYRERQDVSLRVLTEPFWLFCRSAATGILQGSTKDVAHGGEYVVQAEPLVTMGSLARLLLVAGGFLAMQDYLKFCIRLVGCKVFQGNSMYHVEGVVALPQVGIPVHLLRPCSAECPKGDNGFAPHVLALGEWRFEDLEECSGASNDSIERNEDVQGLVSDYKEVPAEAKVWKTSMLQFEPDDEALYLELLRIEAKADVRETFAKLCEQCCVAVVSTEDNEIVDAIAQSVDGMLLHEAAVPLLTQFGWRRRDMEEQDDASFTLWDPPDAAPVLPGFFRLSIRPPPPDPPGLSDTVWSVIISFDAELPFELVWQSVELDVKNAFTSVSNKWSEIGWPGGEQEMLEVVHKAVASNGEAAVARGLTHSSASRIADRLMAAVACRVVAEPEAAQAQGSASRGKGNAKSALRDLVEIKMQDAWMPAVVVQEAPQTLYVSLATGALATGKHRNMPGFEGPRLYPVPPVEPQVQTRADLQALERGAESSRVTRRFNVDAECQEGARTEEPAARAVAPVLTRGAWLPKPTLAYELGGSSSSTSPPSVSLLRGKEVRVDGCSWVSASWTTVGLPELNSSGKVYYELHIESHDTPQIGWASEKFRFFGDTWLYGVGDDLESWGVDGARQKIWHGGEAGSYPSSWAKEVVVGCAADVPAGILQFSTDGVWVTPATFTGVQCASIYPAVSGQMTATFKIRPEEWLHCPPDESFTALSACVRIPQSLSSPLRFPPEWALAKGLQHLAERQKVDLLTTLRLSCSVVLPTLEDLYTAQTKRREDQASAAVEDASDELFDFVLDQDGQPRASEAWEETLDTLGLSAETAAGAALRLLWQADADVQSTRLSAKLQDLCSHQVALVSDSMPSWVLRLGTLMPQLFDRHCREVLLRSVAFGLPFAVHDRQTREVDRRYSEVMKAAEGRVAQAKNLGDSRALSQAYEHLFELTKQISQDPEVWIGSLTSELAKVDRERIWDQATALAECCLSSSGVVEVQFKDETGFGRGVTQGFFSDVAKELQRTSHNSNVPMWAECLESEGEFLRSRRGLVVQPLRAEDPRLPAVLARFRSLGRLLALALRESFVVPLPLAATVLRQLRGEKVGCEHLPQPGDGLAGEFVGACARFRADIAELSQEQRQSLAKDPGWAAQYLETSEALGSFQEWASNAEFLATGFSGPSLPTPESKDQARHVSLESLDDFVDAACSFWLDVGVREQVRSLRRGLHDVLGPRTGALWLFSPLELRELFCGVESVSWTSQDLYDHLHPAGGLTRDDDVMAWLRDELLEMSQALRARFLDFATSCPRLPPGGLASLKLTASPGAGRFPRSRACANQLYLPKYESRQELHEKLTEALLACEGHHDADH